MGGDNEPATVMDSESVDFNDMNADGLPDLLKTEMAGGRHWAYLNQGEQGPTGQRAIRWSGGIEIDAGSGDALNFTLSHASTHLADMDGDGLADLVHRVSEESVFYFPNRGRVAWAERQPLALAGEAPPAPFGQPNVRTADLDFDKRTDIIESVPSGNGFEYHIWFNLGGEGYSRGLTLGQERGFDLTQPTVQIADLNGDRVPDIAQVWPASVEVTAGLGYGRFTSPRAIPIPDGPLDDSLVVRAKLQDLNGDGLADLVIDRTPDGDLWYWLNQGNYRLTPRKRVTGLPVRVSANAVVRWADLNGNGTTDLIYADSQAAMAGFPRLQAVDVGRLINQGNTPNALVEIHNGIGRVTQIEYRSSVDYALEDAAAGRAWPDPMPFPVQVVAAVTNLDSLGHRYATQFRYHDGYYDPAEKQFRGFARVEQVDLGDPTAPTSITRSRFDTGRRYEAMKGRLLGLEAEQEDGKTFWSETNTWTVPPLTLYTGVNGSNVVYAHPTAKVRLVSELGVGVPRRLESEMEFDRFGNQTLEADYGIVENGDRAAFNDERIAVTEYALNTNAWILRHPRQQEIRDPQGKVISRSQFFYDDETFSGNNLGEVTVGNLTLKRDWIWPTNAAAYIQAARTKYDSYGNPVLLLDPLGAAPEGAPDVSQGHAREFAFDPRFHIYPTLETIHVGGGSPPLTFQAEYDPAFGVVAASIDFNGHRTGYSYDGFARLIGIVRPGDSPDFPTVEYDYTLALPVGADRVVNFVETRQLDRDPGDGGGKRDRYFISRQFVDGLGRKLLTKTEAEPAPGSTTPRAVVQEATRFNARQKPSQVLNPCFSRLAGDSLDDLLAFENIEATGWQGTFQENGSSVSLNLDSAHALSTVYDATLRAVRVTNPDGTFRRTVYEPLLSKEYDENQTDPASPNFDAHMTHYQDGLGRLVQVDEVVRLNDDGTSASDLRAWPTRYEYDLNDQLTRITDSQNNVKWFEYDGLKRKVFMNDPDRGTMRFAYDDASNLKETVDAKGQRIAYTYDGANRIRTETYHDGKPAPPWRPPSSSAEGSLGQAEAVIYHYDSGVSNLDQGDTTVATANNTKGALAWVEDLSGEEHTSYDNRGRIEWLVKRIPDPIFLALYPGNTPLVGYKTAFQYDSLDRLRLLTYPDADQAPYEYNERTLLRRIPGGPNGSILSNLVYQASAQNAQIDYGNGVRTTYDYDSRMRLNRLHTHHPERGSELIDYSYDFDGVSNIKSIEDRRPGSAVAEGDPRRNTQIFQYDDLHRLTRAQYSFELPGQPKRNDGVIEYRYDRLGNMLAQTSTLDHQEKGLPVANLGEMDSGGAAGCWNRKGRGPAEEPGPHALTAIRHASASTRQYPYDANGNMRTIDGLACTWDFKDRLVAVENDEMSAGYAYDYTDRRIVKNVTYKPGSANLTNHDARITTLYVNRYFEVREHDAPTKYVWNGNTRVARVTGTLNSKLRVQRLRAYPGWNLCSLAVTTTNAPGLFAAAFRWEPSTHSWTEGDPRDPWAAGTVLWLKASTNAALTVTGTYSDPTNLNVSAGGHFVPSAGLEAWCWTNSAFGPQSSAVSLWCYAAAKNQWLISPLQAQSDLPAFIGPGAGMFVRADTPAQLQVPASALRIRYYHQDHLGSVGFSSDADGSLVSQSSLYPFGYPRTAYQTRHVRDDYTLTQKELDRESRLYFFESRFANSPAGRFLSTDPAKTTLQVGPGLGDQMEMLQEPQRLHVYSYALSNPLRYVDPSGLSETEMGSEVGAVLDTFKQKQELSNTQRKQTRITSTDRSISEQAYYILTRSAYPVRNTETFKKLFSKTDLERFEKLKGLSWSGDKQEFTKQWNVLSKGQRDFLEGYIKERSGKPNGYAHVGGQAVDVSVESLSTSQRLSLRCYLEVSGYSVLLEVVKGKNSIYKGVAIESATVFHITRSGVMNFKCFAVDPIVVTVK